MSYFFCFYCHHHYYFTLFYCLVYLGLNSILYSILSLLLFRGGCEKVIDCSRIVGWEDGEK